MRIIDKVNEIRQASGQLAEIELVFLDGSKVSYTATEEIKRNGNIGEFGKSSTEFRLANGQMKVVEIEFEESFLTFSTQGVFSRKGNL